VHTFDFPSETLELQHFHFELKDDPRMDGQPVLVVMQPPLYMRSSRDLRMVGKGLVLVEDPGSI